LNDATHGGRDSLTGGNNSGSGYVQNWLYGDALKYLTLPMAAATRNTQAETDSDIMRLTQPAKPELSADEIRAFRTRLAKLWTVPAGAKNPEELIVRIRFQLNRERRIVGTPTVLTAGSSPLFKASRESALQAVMAAQPFTMLFPEHDEAWKDIEITFDPREKH
jgi:hypothetical protein